MADVLALRKIAAGLRQRADDIDAIADGEPYMSEEERRARFIIAVIGEIADRGSPVLRTEVLAIAESKGYDRHGPGGFYGSYLRMEKDAEGVEWAVLTDEGRGRLEAWKKRYPV